MGCTMLWYFTVNNLHLSALTFQINNSYISVHSLQNIINNTILGWLLITCYGKWTCLTCIVWPQAKTQDLIEFYSIAPSLINMSSI